MRFRIQESTRARIADAARRHGVTSAEVMRRAVRCYTKAKAVNLDEYDKECTRTESVVVTAAGIDKRATDGIRIDSVLNWYIDTKDDGSNSAAGRMSPDDTVNNSDGSVTYLGGAI